MVVPCIGEPHHTTNQLDTTHPFDYQGLVSEALQPPKGEGLTRTTAVEESLAGIHYTAGPPSEAALVLVMLGEAWETRGA